MEVTMGVGRGVVVVNVAALGLKTNGKALLNIPCDSIELVRGDCKSVDVGLRE
jgi:hypothetical protein